jgi:hypothetical protein
LKTLLIIKIQLSIINAAMGLYDDGKTGGTLNSWGQYAKSGDIIFAVAGGLGAGVALRASSKVVGKIKKYTPINPGPCCGGWFVGCC